MRRLLYRILLFFGFFSVFGLLFLVAVAYSTRWFGDIEEYCFPQPGLWAGTFERSQDLEVWLEKKQVDSLSGIILGGSTIYRNIDPYILSEQIGIDFFNAGSNSQPLSNSCILLRYCLESGKSIKYAIVSVDHVLWDNNGFESSVDWVVNNFNPGVSYTYDMVVGSQVHLLWFSYCYLRIKQFVPGTRVYLDSTRRGDYYSGKGFVCSSDEIPRTMDAAVPIPEMNGKNRKALHEIVRLCKENNIQLTFLVPKLINAEYDLSVIKQFNHNIIDASAAPVDTSLFYDNYHLYCKGTAQYTQWIANEFTRQNNPTD